MITLKTVDSSNIWDIVELDVHDYQRGWVMNANDSIIEAFGIRASGGWAMPLGIYDDDTPVGFAMFTFGNAPCDSHPTITPENYELNRFYIDKKYQKMGYGKKSIQMLLDYIRTLPCGSADWCWIGWKPDNQVAERLYTSVGFVKTKMHHGDECVGLLSLKGGKEPV